MSIRTVLFDLDGTLADTAPDLAYALNAVLQEEGREPLAYARIRPLASYGTRGLLKLGFGVTPEDPRFARLRQRFLAVYAENIYRETRLFPGMAEVLAALKEKNLCWGIVTNKPGALTDALVAKLGLKDVACVVSGDTTANTKPHPEPMLYACKQTGSVAEECLFVGDADRDIEAGRRAGMKTLVALFGYLGADDQPHLWGADGMVRNPQEILDWLDTHA